jgi:hypothetical protein
MYYVHPVKNICSFLARKLLSFISSKYQLFKISKCTVTRLKIVGITVKQIFLLINSQHVSAQIGYHQVF